MPRRTHPTPFTIHPPDDLTERRPDLAIAAADLARDYAAELRLVGGMLLTDAGRRPITDDRLRQIGGALWAALAAADPTLADRLAEARAAAGTRILPLIVDSGAAARLLPWEALHHPQFGFLGRAPGFALSRRVPGRSPDPDAPERGPLRVVLFTCLPDDLDAEKERLDVEEQQALALQALGQAAAEGRVRLTMPDDGRLTTFQRLMADDPHLVFLFTHGNYHRPLPHERDRAPRATLLFETEAGRGDPVDEARLIEAFTGRGVRAVVLAACQSGMGDSAELAAGFIGALNRAGLPHVVALRESMLAGAAMRFNAAFAAAALAGERVDVALQDARAAITAPLAHLGGAAAELSLGQWPLPALLSHDPAAPLIDWEFKPDTPAKSLTRDALGEVILPSRFIGRRTELRRHKAPLLSGRRPALLITGPGGQGKTALAGKIAADWEAGGGALAVWPATAAWEPFWLRLVELAGPGAAEAVAAAPDETARAAALLRLLLARHDGRFLLFLDNLEAIQDERTLELRDARAAALLAAALPLGPDGLRLLATSRARPPQWPAEAWLPLPPAGYGDFLQMAVTEHAPAAFWRGEGGPQADDAEAGDRPRRVYEALNGNGRGLLFVVANLRRLGGDAAAGAAFLAALAAAAEESRVDMALDALLDRLSDDERAFLGRLAAYDAPVPREGLLRLGLDLPDPDGLIDRLLALSLLERYDDPEWDCAAWLAAPPAVARLAARGVAPDAAALRAAADYQAWLYEHERPVLGQAMALHRALSRAGERAAAERLALRDIIRPLHRAGLYRLLLAEWLPALRESAGDRTRAAGLGWSGRCHLSLGESDQALPYFEQSLALSRAGGDRAGEGATLNNISQIYDARGDYDTALTYLQQSLAIQRAIGDRAGEGATLNNISQIYDARGDYDTALTYLQQSLAIRRAIGDRAGEGTTLNNISQIYMARGDYDTALTYLQQSLAIQRAIGDASGLSATLINMGHIYLQNEQVEEALGAWVTAYQIASRIGYAQALAALEQLAEQLGLPGGLAGWAALAERMGDGGLET